MNLLNSWNLPLPIWLSWMPPMVMLLAQVMLRSVSLTLSSLTTISWVTSRARLSLWCLLKTTLSSSSRKKTSGLLIESSYMTRKACGQAHAHIGCWSVSGCPTCNSSMAASTSGTLNKEPLIQGTNLRHLRDQEMISLMRRLSATSGATNTMWHTSRSSNM